MALFTTGIALLLLSAKALRMITFISVVPCAALTYDGLDGLLPPLDLGTIRRRRPVSQYGAAVVRCMLQCRAPYG